MPYVRRDEEGHINAVVVEPMFGANEYIAPDDPELLAYYEALVPPPSAYPMAISPEEMPEQ
ncbi:hypothetical protein ACC757_29405 [Rhizobium ruizarguesonis]|jgi:hypothetical protein